MLLTGDVLATRNPLTGRVGPQIMPSGLNRDTPQALRSLDVLEGVPADVLLPGHGEPWTEGAGRGGAAGESGRPLLTEPARPVTPGGSGATAARVVEPSTGRTDARQDRRRPGSCRRSRRPRAGLSTFAPSDMTRSWAAAKSSTHRSRWICCGGVPSGQSGGDVVGRQLNPDPWCTVDDHHVPVILGIDGAVEHPGPEAALGREVCGVEHDDLMIDAHRVILFKRDQAGPRYCFGVTPQHSSKRAAGCPRRPPRPAARAPAGRVQTGRRRPAPRARAPSGWRPCRRG